jgi:small subunit ribosomal protein S9
MKKTSIKKEKKPTTKKPVTAPKAVAVKKPAVTKVETKEKFSAGKDFSRSVGRRKRASARVRITKGQGKIIVNGQDFEKYFSHITLQEIVLLPLKAMGKDKSLDVSVKVAGGGKKGQADAVKHGIARALVLWNEDFKKTLKSLGFLTRDARKKERKKFGLKKARRAPQWSKR